jgi:hypothetical protein
MSEAVGPLRFDGRCAVVAGTRLGSGRAAALESDRLEDELVRAVRTILACAPRIVRTGAGSGPSPSSG